MGVAAEPAGIGLYGPLVKSIHYLESKCANYPRIIVGDNCIELLRRCAVGSTDNVGTITQRLICYHADNLPMVDFLGKEVNQATRRNRMRKKADRAETYVGRAYHFIREMKEKFRLLSNSANGKKKEEANKLYKRYSMLFDYVSQRKSQYWC